MSGARLASVLDGPADAPLLVLSGSLGSTLDMWEPQVPGLSRTWRLLRFDHPGHGASPVWTEPVTVEAIGRAVLEFLDEAGYSRVCWCGLSLGGAVGQWVAAHAPERIERLILCCTLARFNTDLYSGRAVTVRERGMEAVVEAVIGRWFTPSFGERHPEVVARYRAMLEGIPPEGYAACCEAVARFDSRPYLASITAPTRVIAGRDDMATPVAGVRDLCERIPNARLEIIEDAAHLANVEQCRAVERAILSHLGGDVGEESNG